MSHSANENHEPLNYQSGFGNYFESESVTGALPIGRNSPQQPPFGLHAEQISGTSFLAPRSENLRSWLYRRLPSVCQGPMERLSLQELEFENLDLQSDPNPTRWNPIDVPHQPTDFIESWVPHAASGAPTSQRGCLMAHYAVTASMNRYFYDADGELLIIPEKGTLKVQTEMGQLTVGPGEILVIPRGIKFRVVLLKDHPARGYLCENYGAPFRLPNLGPIGSNGLANPRDFLFPQARTEDPQGACTLVTKYAGLYWQTELPETPLNVVAWHGNYAPYKYDLARFNTINTVSFDHPDPSIFTVLTSPSDTEGVSNIDFVIFPPRWMVAQDTFRPPYFHRNFMSEYMGLIKGQYDGKREGFVPGGASLHNAMTPHGPDSQTVAQAIQSDLRPEYLNDTLAFMIECRYPYALTQWARNSSTRQKNYHTCWQDIPSAQLMKR